MPIALLACPGCGLVQEAPAIAAGALACHRCRHHLGHADPERARTRTAALATAALLIYPVAVFLPVLEISRLGHHHATGILPGILDLMRDGKWAIGVIVFVFSIALPLLKLAGLLTLSLDRGWIARPHQALTWRLVELSGRWGMLDVLLVAILVAALKLGDLVHVTPGPGLFLFTTCVGLSLLASAAFDPRAIWNDA